MNNNYKYEAFIPAKFTIGLNDKSDGFPSMKDKDGKWSNLTFFQKHSGFKPHVERDASKEITKELTQRVQVVENVPMSGFKVVKFHSWLYKGTDLYKDTECVVLRDPRGWDVQIAIENFSLLLKSNGMNLKNGVLEGVKVMYGWPTRSYSPFSLYVADEHAQKMKDATCKLISNYENVVYFTPSQFEVGKIYSSKTSKMREGGSMYMYLGKHAVYSDECHFKAVMRKDYSDLQEFIDNRNDITNTERHVFYCLDPKCDLKDNYWAATTNSISAAPYYVASSLSKLFEKVEDVDPSKFKMYNDSAKLATLENIKADMEVSAYFNQVDFEKSNSYVDVSYQVLEDFYGQMYDVETSANAKAAAFPFYISTSGIFLHSKKYYSSIRIASNMKEYAIHEAKKRNDGYGYGYGYSYTYAKYEFDEKADNKEEVFKKLYDEVKPYVVQYVFRNGKKVPEYQNMMLNTCTHYRDIK